jgi:hypothetical protein
VKVNHIAKWDGSSWSALGSGTDEWVFAVAVTGTDVYMAGSFTMVGGVPAGGIAKWDGSNWSALGSSTSGFGYAIALSGNDVYVGGSFTTAGGVTANNIAKWDGSTWSALGSGTNGPVGEIALSGSDMYVGGNFTTAGGVTVNYIAKWDGSNWSALGSGTNASVGGIATSGSDVYVGGSFTLAGDMGINRIAKWNGSAWSPLGSGTNNRVSAMTLTDSNLYITGDFTMVGELTVNHTARWDGSTWSALGSGLGLSSVGLSVEHSGTDVYFGGGFTRAGGQPANNVAVWRENAIGTPTPTSTISPTSTPRPNICTLQYTDVLPDSTFYLFIKCLACRWIISGSPCGADGEPCDPGNNPYFRPNVNVTRGQIAKIVSNSAGYDEDPNPQIYEDVDPSNTFYQWINRLSRRGHIGGYPCGTVPEEPCNPPDDRPYFRPFYNATRGQLAKIVSNAAGFSDTPPDQIFTDVLPESGFYLWIQRLASRGIMGGYQCGGVGEPCDDQERPYFRSYNNVTRGQTSKIVAGAFFPNCQTPNIK